MDNDLTNRRFPAWRHGLNRRELGRGFFLLSLVGLMLGRIPQAMASGRWFGPPRHHGHHGHHAWGHWRHHRFDDIEQAKQHAQEALEHLLDHVDATDEQRSRATAVVDRAVEEVFADLQSHHSAHEDLKNLLGAESIDRTRLETLRGEQAERWERVSSKLTNSLADLAEVFDAEQRRALLAHWPG